MHLSLAAVVPFGVTNSTVSISPLYLKNINTSPTFSPFPLDMKERELRIWGPSDD